jgi:hypothetical protein
MLDGDEAPDRDRLLVRPYVQPGSEPTSAPSIHAEEVPDPASPEPFEGDQQATAVLPAATEPESDQAADGADRRMVLLLVGGGLALILAAAVAVIALWPSGDDPQSAVQPGSTIWPNGSGGPATTPAPSARVSGSAAGKASTSVTTSPRGTTGAPTRRVPGAPPASPRPTTLGPPPAADRVGTITGAGGHCLDIRGGIALLGSPVSAYACNNTSSQRWTLAADGTLRVGGSCAAADGAAATHLAGCDSSSAGQWRSGPGGTLVNVGTSRCLTDPDNGAKTGGAMTLAACGAAGQRWVLP